ncbi:MAG: M23 family metallopeptidase [Ilumatobacteraceae bacterium]
MNRRLAWAVALALALIGAPARAAAGAGPTVAQCLPPPVTVPIAAPFQAPPCPYCAGHRGVAYRPPPGTVVRAVISGTVTFAGPVAGVRWVVVADAEGRRWSYGHLAAVLLHAGQQVAAGQPVGLSGPYLHLGLRMGEAYADPAPLLGRWVGRPRLVPVDGAPPRPPTAPRLTCP